MSLLIYIIVLLIVCIFLSLLSSCAVSYSVPSDFKRCLLEHLYYKDCITTRQSWLLSFYIVINKNNKQDKTKLENITIVFYSITYYHPLFRYTTVRLASHHLRGLMIHTTTWLHLSMSNENI